MPQTAIPDERLELIFMCCHPALALEAQVALTLRAVAGLTYALVDSHYKPDAAAGEISDFVPDPPAIGSPPTSTFPYLGVPYSGYNHPS